MIQRERLIEALEGGEPDRTPLSIYDWVMGAITSDELATRMADPDWRGLIDAGLVVRHHCPTVRAIEHDTRYSVSEETRDGTVYRTETRTTPIGSITKTTETAGTTSIGSSRRTTTRSSSGSSNIRNWSPTTTRTKGRSRWSATRVSSS